MKPILLCLVLICLFNHISQAQLTPDTISCFNGRYYFQEQHINNNMLYKILGEDADASKYVSRYKSNRSTGSILVGVGTVLFFTGTAVAVANKASEDVWSATTGEEKSHSAGGIILIVLGVTLDISGIAVMADSKNILKQGVRVYNSNHRISSFNKIEFHLITGGNGLGIRMKF